MKRGLAIALSPPVTNLLPVPVQENRDRSLGTPRHPSWFAWQLEDAPVDSSFQVAQQGNSLSWDYLQSLIQLGTGIRNGVKPAICAELRLVLPLEQLQ